MARDANNLPVIDCYNERYKKEYIVMRKNQEYFLKIFYLFIYINRFGRYLFKKKIDYENKIIYERIAESESAYKPGGFVHIFPRPKTKHDKKRKIGNPLYFIF